MWSKSNDMFFVFGPLWFVLLVILLTSEFKITKKLLLSLLTCVIFIFIFLFVSINAIEHYEKTKPFFSREQMINSLSYSYEDKVKFNKMSDIQLTIEYEKYWSKN